MTPNNSPAGGLTSTDTAHLDDIDRRHLVDDQGAVPGADPTRTIRVVWDPASVAEVRRIIVADLQAREELPEQIIDEAEMVASELVANALRHARPLHDGMLRVHWKVKPPVVEIEVTDGGGETVPKAAPIALWASSGRGLRIVRSLAHEWGVVPARNGITVWAALGGPSRRRTS
ncbi:ATP-binding protein [Actinomycetota bacterium]